MTTDRNTIIAAEFDRLFRTYKQPDRNADPSDLVRERMAKAQVYFEAVSIYEIVDIQAGVQDFISGAVPGHNPSFEPPAPLVGSVVRRAMMRRLDAERLNKLALPPPADDFVQDPPEVRARNKARLEQLSAEIGKTIRTEDAEGERLKRDLQERTRQRFAPSMEKRDMVQRLGIQSYFVGDDPEAEYGDMGQSRASA